MTRRSALLAAFAAVAAAVGALPAPWDSVAVAASVALSLAAGLALPAHARGAVVRGAAVGAVANALLRAALLWQAGGPEAVSVGASAPPALIGLAAAILGVLTGRWWRGIWRLAAESGPRPRHA